MWRESRLCSLHRQQATPSSWSFSHSKTTSSERSLTDTPQYLLQHHVAFAENRRTAFYLSWARFPLQLISCLLVQNLMKERSFKEKLEPVFSTHLRVTEAKMCGITMDVLIFHCCIKIYLGNTFLLGNPFVIQTVKAVPVWIDSSFAAHYGLITNYKNVPSSLQCTLFIHPA